MLGITQWQGNIKGFKQVRNDIKTYVLTQTINSDVVIACIDTFFPSVSKPTVIVVDQSSIHISDALIDKFEELHERNITIKDRQLYHENRTIFTRNLAA